MTNSVHDICNAKAYLIMGNINAVELCTNHSIQDNPVLFLCLG